MDVDELYRAGIQRRGIGRIGVRRMLTDPEQPSLFEFIEDLLGFLWRPFFLADRQASGCFAE